MGFIRKDRTTGRCGGGVAICYNKNKIDMCRAKLPHSRHEIVAAITRRQDQRRKVLVLGLYIPPWYNRDLNNSFCNYVSDCLVLFNNR